MCISEFQNDLCMELLLPSFCTSFKKHNGLLIPYLHSSLLEARKFGGYNFISDYYLPSFQLLRGIDFDGKSSYLAIFYLFLFYASQFANQQATIKYIFKKFHLF